MRSRDASSNLDFPEMQDIYVPFADLSARWEEQVPYVGTRQFSKRLANVLDIPHVPPQGPATVPPDETFEVDREEGSNPDQAFSWQTRPAVAGRAPEGPCGPAADGSSAAEPERPGSRIAPAGYTAAARIRTPAPGRQHKQDQAP